MATRKPQNRLNNRSPSRIGKSVSRKSAHACRRRAEFRSLRIIQRRDAAQRRIRIEHLDDFDRAFHAFLGPARRIGPEDVKSQFGHSPVIGTDVDDDLAQVEIDGVILPTG